MGRRAPEPSSGQSWGLWFAIVDRGVRGWLPTSRITAAANTSSEWRNTSSWNDFSNFMGQLPSNAECRCWSRPSPSARSSSFQPRPPTTRRWSWLPERHPHCAIQPGRRRLRVRVLGFLSAASGSVPDRTQHEPSARAAQRRRKSESARDRDATENQQRPKTRDVVTSNVGDSED